MNKVLFIVGLIITITSCNTTKQKDNNSGKIKKIGRNAYAVEQAEDLSFLDTLSNKGESLLKIDLFIRDTIILSKPIVVKNKPNILINFKKETDKLNPTIIAKNSSCLIIEGCDVNIDGINFIAEQAEFAISCTNSKNFYLSQSSILLKSSPSLVLSNGLKVTNTEYVEINNANFECLDSYSSIKINSPQYIDISNSSFSGKQEYNLILENTSDRTRISNCNFSGYSSTAIYTTFPNLDIDSNTFLDKQDAYVSYPDSIKELIFPWDDLLHNIFYINHRNYDLDIDEDERDDYVFIPYGNFFRIYNYGTISDVEQEFLLENALEQFVNDQHPEKNNLFNEYWEFAEQANKSMESIVGHGIFSKEGNSNTDPWCIYENGESKFHLYNPEFFIWMRKSLKFEKTEVEVEEVNDVEETSKNKEEQTWWIPVCYDEEEPEPWDYFDIYNNLFKDFFRNYYIIYKYLNDADNTDDILTLFKNEADKNWYFDFEKQKIMLFHVKSTYSLSIEYNDSLSTVIIANEDNTDIEDSFDGLNYRHSTAIKNNEICNSTFMDIGSFWFRRMLDGSASELFKTLEHYMNIFDEEWIKTYDTPNGPIVENKNYTNLQDKPQGDPGCVTHGEFIAEDAQINRINQSNTYKLFLDNFPSSGLVLYLEMNPSEVFYYGDESVTDFGQANVYMLFEDSLSNTYSQYLYDAHIRFNCSDDECMFLIDDNHIEKDSNGHFYVYNGRSEDKRAYIFPNDLPDGKYNVQVVVYLQEDETAIFSNILSIQMPFSINKP